jgi:hypothetical protein
MDQFVFSETVAGYNTAGMRAGDYKEITSVKLVQTVDNYCIALCCLSLT